MVAKRVRARAEAPVRDRKRVSLPLRARLALWYLLTMAAILVLLLSFLYWQVQRSLLAQVDETLRLTATQALTTVDVAGDALSFQAVTDSPVRQRVSDDFAIYLLDADGAVWDTLGQYAEFAPLAPRPGWRTVIYDGEPWRVFTEAVPMERGGHSREGWIQVAQELDVMTETLTSLRYQILWGIPLALFLAGLGGFFLARRALRPIKRITQTAQTINAGDLSRRIDYEGPADEVGRLAATFNKMLDRLESAFERERRFTGDAAHELRTPLTAMKGRVEVTLSRPRAVAEYTETLQEIGSQVERLIHLSNDLLFMARLDQGRQQTIRREAVSLADLLPAVIDQVQPLARRKDIGLDQEIPAAVAVEGDLDLLIRLFLNLLDNAIKYTPAGGRVAVRVKASGEEAVVAVSDSGPGIPTEHLPHLFERFYRVEGDRARYLEEDGQGGAGLGLAIAAEIVRVHGGRIEVESTMGEGTTFTVRLPLYGDEGKSPLSA